MNTKIYVNDCRFGKGVFAARRIKSGEIILTFDGPLISFQECASKGINQGNPLQIGDNLYIDIGPPALWVNHSCSPNAGIVKDRVLVALRDVEADEEICYDYSTTMLDGHWAMECKCGLTACRKIISDFIHLPENLKQLYLESGIVQKFIICNLTGCGKSP